MSWGTSTLGFMPSVLTEPTYSKERKEQEKKMNRSLEEELERYPRISLTRLPTPLQALPSLRRLTQINYPKGYDMLEEWKISHNRTNTNCCAWWLNERQWRLYVATEARKIGAGGISQIAREAGVTRKTIRKGIQELEAGACYQPGERLRKPGGGRKNITEKDKTLETDLEAMLEPKGDPQSLVKWTSKSVSKLRGALSSQGHTIGETAIRRMLHARGFSLKANKKRMEGTSPADRDAQFQHINRTGKAFQAKGKPVMPGRL
jgi:transposase